jgi:hypothetical protein
VKAGSEEPECQIEDSDAAFNSIPKDLIHRERLYVERRILSIK